MDGLDGGEVVVLVNHLSVHASGDFLDYVKALGSAVAPELTEVLDAGDVLELADVLGSIDGFGSVNLGSIKTVDGGGLRGLFKQLSSLAFSALSIDASREFKNGLGILDPVVDPALAGGLGSSIVVGSAGAEVGWALSLSFTKTISQKFFMESNRGRVYARHDMRESMRDWTCLTADRLAKGEGAGTYSCNKRTTGVVVVVALSHVGVVLAILVEVLQGL